MKLLEVVQLFFKSLGYYHGFKHTHEMNSDELKKYQYEHLKNVLIYANKKVPYYRNLFRSIDFVPERDFNDVSDLIKIPYTDKDTVRKYRDEFLSEDIQSMYIENDSTSGSTGTPLTFALDTESRAAKYAMVYKMRRGGGYFLHNKAFSLWGVYAIIKNKPFGIDKLKNIVFYANNKMTNENNIAVGELLCKYKPVQFEGYARSFLELGKSLREANLPIWSPKSIFCYGDALTEETRKALTEIYQTKVYDFYSHTENIVVVGEFEPGVRYMMEDFFYPEVIYEGNSNRGELVGTSFFNFAMPLIRYKTRDIVEVDTNRNENDYVFTKVKSIVGRVNDYLIMSDGRKVLSIQRAIYGCDKIIASQIIQESTTNLLVRLIVEKDFDKSSLPKIAKGMEQVCGTELNADFEIVDELEKNASGKAPFIIRKFEE